MLRQGPISVALHGILDYVLAVVLIAAPLVLTFDSDAATAVSIVAGVLVLIGAATTDGFPTALIKSIPTAAHLVGDLVGGALFIAAPWLFDFKDHSEPTVFFLVLGVLTLLLTIATRWRPPA